jgi:hypothetical protein
LWTRPWQSIISGRPGIAAFIVDIATATTTSQSSLPHCRRLLRRHCSDSDDGSFTSPCISALWQVSALPCCRWRHCRNPPGVELAVSRNWRHRPECLSTCRDQHRLPVRRPTVDHLTVEVNRHGSWCRRRAARSLIGGLRRYTAARQQGQQKN